MMTGKIGPYQIRKRLGSGGMGEVYQAYDERLDRQVALKLIRAAVSGDEILEERFRREARSAAGLNHPAIVQIFDILPWRDRDCIVMELVQGRTLRGLLREDGPLAPRRLLPLACEIAEGLAHAHAEGLIHRDLKSDNVMVTASWHAKILDFGLAKRLAQNEISLSVQGGLLGTFHAMSPEQAQGQAVDARSDLFSLGVLLYEALTGRSPFRGETAKETLARVCTARPPSVRVISPRVPQALSELIDHLLEKDPDDRPRSAREVAAVLRGLGEGSASESDESGEAAGAGESTHPAGVPDVWPRGRASSADLDSPTVDASREDPSSEKSLRATNGSATPRRGVTAARRHTAVVLTAIVLVVALVVAWQLRSPEENRRFYAQGLQSLRDLDAPKARDALLKSVEVDDQHAPSHAALAAAWSALGHEDKARAAIGRAMELGAGLPENERLAIAGLSAEVARDWPRAIESYRTLLGSRPNDLDAVLRLTRAQVASGSPGDALGTLRLLPEPAASDPRIELVRALAHYGLERWESSLASAETAARRARDLGAGSVEARARLRQASSHQALAQYDQATAAAEAARALFEQHDDRGGSASALESMALSDFYQGELENARRLLERSLEHLRDIGDRRGETRVRMTLGSVLSQQGNHVAAERHFGEALETFRDIEARPPTIAAVLTNIGTSFYLRGELAQALAKYREAADLLQGLDERDTLATNLTNVGEIFYLQGKLRQAEEYHREALAINRDLRNKSAEAYDTYRLGLVATARGDFQTAENQLLQALATQKTTGADLAAAETSIALARLRLLQGRAGIAEALLRGAGEVMRNARSTDQAALAQALLARAVLVQGRRRAAREQLTLVQAGTDGGQDRRVLSAVAVATAQLQAADGAVDEALKTLETAIAHAEEAGFVGDGLEARLAAVEIEATAGRTSDAAARLQRLIEDENAKDYRRRLIQRRGEVLPAAGDGT